MDNEPRKIVVMGSTGNIARHLIEEALSRGHQVTAVARPGSEKKLEQFSGRITVVNGDPNDEGDWMSAFAGQDQFLHLIGILKEDPAHGVTFERAHRETVRLGLRASAQGGVQWVTHMSAAMNIPGASFKYIRTKREAEELIKQSGLHYTIFRPSMVYGGTMVFGSAHPIVIAARLGTSIMPRMRPVEVHTLVRSLLNCFQSPRATDAVLAAPEIYALSESK